MKPQETAPIRASVPQQIEAEVMLELNRLGGIITSVEQERDSRTAIVATVPKKHVGDFTVWLHRVSGGHASLSEDQK
jgi:hypothetical protein